MVNTSTDAAITWNDISVNENMHAAMAFRLLSQPQVLLLRLLDDMLTFPFVQPTSVDVHILALPPSLDAPSAGPVTNSLLLVPLGERMLNDCCAAEQLPGGPRSRRVPFLATHCHRHRACHRHGIARRLGSRLLRCCITSQVLLSVQMSARLHSGLQDSGLHSAWRARPCSLNG